MVFLFQGLIGFFSNYDISFIPIWNFVRYHYYDFNNYVTHLNFTTICSRLNFTSKGSIWDGIDHWVLRPPLPLHLSSLSLSLSNNDIKSKLYLNSIFEKMCVPYFGEGRFVQFTYILFYFLLNKRGGGGDHMWLTPQGVT